MKEIKHYKVGKYFDFKRQYINNYSTTITKENDAILIDDHGSYELHEQPKFESLEEAEKYVITLIKHFKKKHQKIVRLDSQEIEKDGWYWEFFDDKRVVVFYLTTKHSYKQIEEKYNGDILDWIVQKRPINAGEIHESKTVIFEDGDVEKLLLDKLP